MGWMAVPAGGAQAFGRLIVPAKTLRRIAWIQRPWAMEWRALLCRLLSV
jgi:hypothetical protein